MGRKHSGKSRNCLLTLSSIYTHFNTFKKKSFRKTLWKKVKLLTYRRFVWANGRAAGIGITIPVCSIGRLPLLEPLPSLPNIEWKRRQSFRNKMAEAANETSFEEFFFFNLTFVFVVKYKSSCLYLVIRLLIFRIHFGVVNIW